MIRFTSKLPNSQINILNRSLRFKMGFNNFDTIGLRESFRKFKSFDVLIRYHTNLFLCTLLNVLPSVFFK